MKIPAYFKRYAKPHQLNGFLECSAIYSLCRRYRYTLTRVWDRDKPLLLFIGVNPSTATHLSLDPTITRVVKRAKREGFGSLRVVNLFGYRSTDPRGMRRSHDPVGQHNNKFLLSSAEAARTILCGWGNHGVFRGRDCEVSELIRRVEYKCVCIDISNTGCPKHPLYLADSLPFRPFRLPSHLSRLLHPGKC